MKSIINENIDSTKYHKFYAYENNSYIENNVEFIVSYEDVTRIALLSSDWSIFYPDPSGNGQNLRYNPLSN